MKKILVINPGSTSTKLAIYENMKLVNEVNLKLDEEFARAHYMVMEQAEHRTELILNFMKDNGYKVEDFDIIAARGGWLPPCGGGVYAVNQLMLDVLTYAPLGQHASSLGAVIGTNLAQGRIPVIICDSVSTDELRPMAKMTGMPGVTREPAYHVLNTRYAAKEVAEKRGIPFEKGRFIVVHMGGGSSILAYEDGKLVDFDNDVVTPQRSGRMPFPYKDLVAKCFSGEYTQQQITKMLMGEGGFYLYTGTQDALSVEKKALAGDETCQKLYELMAYQLNKCIGEMYAALDYKVDALIITGALAKSPLLIEPLKKTYEGVLSMEIIPGERELEALAKAACDVLSGKEIAKEYDVLPKGMKTVEEFYDFVAAEKAKK